VAYKAEHVVDLESEMILAAEIYHADQADTQTLEDSVQQAQTNLREAGTVQRNAAGCIAPSARDFGCRQPSLGL
jgi:hypothetical protein